ncbi:hypothetical protein ccbrp13_53480 [Ktedonobacteria bacterium brp13]|nr:hypothetical protein ccbrp13_53480 [Ktedonobacteria bacterium brp13]
MLSNPLVHALNTFCTNCLLTCICYPLGRGGNHLLPVSSVAKPLTSNTQYSNFRFLAEPYVCWADRQLVLVDAWDACENLGDDFVITGTQTLGDHLGW